MKKNIWRNLFYLKKVYLKEDLVNGFENKLFPIESENTQYLTSRGSRTNASEFNEFFNANIKNSGKNICNV